MSASIYDIPVRRMTGKDSSLAEFKGKVVLIVNVASKCGLTKQYDALEKLYKEYHAQGLVVAGFPANDFAGQEPGTNEEIQAFCKTSFDVNFPMFEKITVVGPQKHPLYQALIKAQPKTESVTTVSFRETLKGHGISPNPEPEVLWNFEKFLVNREGQVVKRFSPDTTPDDPLFIATVKAELVKTAFVDIKTQDGKCDTFIAYPDNETPHPAILFLMDGIGPRDYLYDMAKTLAAHGYYVLLPNLFYRERRAPLTDMKFPVSAEDMPKLIGQIMPLFKTYTPELGMHDADVFLDFIAKQKQVLSGKIGITGYCMGGGLAFRIAARHPERVAAAASFHGGSLATEAPDSPHRLLGRIKAALYIGHADNDQHMTAEQINLLQSALEKSGIRYEAELYKGAAHGFTMVDLPAYNEAALRKHWSKLFELFGRILGNKKE